MDARFSSSLTAPLFQRSKSEKHKVKLDDRFKGVLSDERFRVVPGGVVDKYGRKVNKKKNNQKATDELQEFYQIDTTNDDNQSKANNNEKSAKDKNRNSNPKGTNNMEERLEYLNKLARGEGSDDSESNSDSDSTKSTIPLDNDEDDDNSVSFSKNETINVEYELIGNETERLAIQNIDWENIKSVDIMVALQSFCQAGSSVLSVTIYPSDFGKERMAWEALHGPPRDIWKVENENDQASDDESDLGQYEIDEDASDQEEENLVKKTKHFVTRKKGEVGIVMSDEEDDAVDNDNDDDDEIENDEVNSEVEAETYSMKKVSKKEHNIGFDEVALREYEKSKLRYYFAIAVCDSPSTANALYQELDQVEFEHSAIVFDLSFVPDEISFSDRDIRDTCSKIPHNYKPSDCMVHTLQHTKVKCSWDEGEKERERKLTNLSQWRQLNESEFRQYIASSDSDNTAKDNDFDNEEKVFTYLPETDQSLKSKIKRGSNIVEETPLEATLRKRAELKKARKEKKILMNNNNDDIIEDENEYQISLLSSKKKKSKQSVIKDDEVDSDDLKESVAALNEKRKGKKNKKIKSNQNESNEFMVDLGDDRFSKVIDGLDARFGIDTSSTEFKDTSAMREILAEQSRRREALRKNKSKTNFDDNYDTIQNDNLETSKLVNQLKRKFGSKS
eukprot:gene4668-6557_t